METKQNDIAILYNSNSGNTRMVAEALERALADDGARIASVKIAAASVAQATGAAAAADTVLVGFWCDKGSCTDEVARVLGGLAGKRVFLFGTAGFGGAPAYFERILAAVRAKLPEDATYLGGAMCQGKMGQGVLARYEAMLAEKPGDARITSMIDNFHDALGHPDEVDLAAIVKAARAAL